MANTSTPIDSTEPLGATAIRLGYVTPEQIDGVLEQQQQRRATGKQHRLLGLLLVDQGFLSSEQLVSMLASDDHSPFPLTNDAVKLAARLSCSLEESDTAILFAGVTNSDGADQVAAQVALAFARMQHGDVLLLDADARYSSLPAKFGIKQAPGFGDVLAGECTTEEATFATASPNLSVLSAGSNRHDMTRLLLSDSGETVMKLLRERHLFVMIHSPPLLGSPVGSLLAIRADTVVTVLAAGRRTKAQVLETKRTLDGLKARSLGVVLTEQGRLEQDHKTVDR